MFLDVKFCSKWIGRDGPTPCALLLLLILITSFIIISWTGTATSLPDIVTITMKAKITDPVTKCSEQMLDNTWRRPECRLDLFRSIEGTHIKNPPKVSLVLLQTLLLYLQFIK